jgi:hypothetical protein
VADEGMSLSERRSYLQQMQSRYRRGSKPQKRDLLDEIEQVTGMHRKSLTRLLNSGDLRPKPAQRRPRRRVYGADVEYVVGLVWESLDGICAERLTPALGTTAEQLEQFGELALTDQLRHQLKTISISTVQRILQRRPQVRPQLPRAATERTNALRAEIPAERICWQTNHPGHFEVDLVHHSGPSATGEYGHSLQLIDVATGWSERVMVLGRSQRAMQTGFEQVLDRLPFPIRELHPDNGSEFFNAHLLQFFGETITGLRLSRSRPFHKNDNRYVEQKNATLVRQYLGFARFDSPDQISQANRLYDDLWTYYNLFQPVMHLADKTYVDGKLRRQWDEAQTPYQRLVSSGVLDTEQAAVLQQRYQQTNPRALRRQIYRQLDQLWRTVSSPAGEDTVSVA